jgi:tetratricopeptide (TPR) repeat protein
MKKYSCIVLSLLMSCAVNVIAQSSTKPSKKVDIDVANEHYDHANYIFAYPIYKDLLKWEPDNKKIKYKLAICYLSTCVNREEAVKLLESLSKEPKCEDEVWFQLGKAYLLTNKLDAAEEALIKFKTLVKKSPEADLQLGYVKNAKQFIQDPVNVTFTNLGKEVNSDEPDYYPFVTGDETFLAFTSRRKDNMGGKKVEVDGYHSSDIYFSKLEAGKWAKAVNAGRLINTTLDEQVVGLKPDGTEMMIYLDHIDKFGDLYVSYKKDGSDFTKGKALDANINKEIETTGALNADGSILFFARRESITSKSDIYACRKLPTGKWALPYKLPETINTSLNEDFPFLAADGVTLYFSSEGHNSMGGYDLFKTTFDPENNTFSKPENLGYPINSTDNDRSISVTPDNRVAYVSAFRPGGMGDLDIYRVRFNDNEQISRIMVGKVFLGDSTLTSQPKELVCTMVAVNKVNGNEYTFVPHRKNGKYVISLPAGNYNLIINASGAAVYKEELNISDLGRIEMEKNRNFLLKRK